MTRIKTLPYKGESSTSLKKNNMIHNSESQLMNATLLGTSTPKSSQEDSKYEISR